MKVVCGYDPGEPYGQWFGGWADEGALVVVSPEEDIAKFASDLRDAEVLLHILRPVTGEVLAGAPHLRLVHRSRGGAATRSGGRQHAGHQYASRRRGGPNAHAVRPAQSAGSGPGVPRRERLGA